MRQPNHKTTRRRIGAAFAAALALTVLVAGSGLAATAVKPYVEPVGGHYQVRALFSVDDKVPLLGGAPSQQYRMVGIPDGTVASGPKVPPAGSRVEPFPVQTAVGSAQKQSILASPMAFRGSGGGRRLE